MSESLAKVTMKSVIDEQIYPTIIPATKSAAMFLIFLATSNIKLIDIMDPTKAAEIIVYEFMYSICCMLIIITKATTIFAPEDIPSTKGPAMGFSKKV